MTQDQKLRQLLDSYCQQLRRLGPAWLQLIGGQPDPLWQPSEELQSYLKSRFQWLNRRNEAADDIGRRCRQVTRGIYLARAALDWDSPSVGSTGPTADIRGEQWRVMMAWAGLEAVMGAVTKSSKDGHGINKLVLEHACRFSEADLPDQLPAPSSRLKKLQEAREWPDEDGTPGMLVYLGLHRGFARDVLKDWLHAGTPLNSSVELLGCAQAIRHATAHGALSSSGIRNWGIRPALLPLTVTTAGVTCGLIRNLMNRAE